MNKFIVVVFLFLFLSGCSGVWNVSRLECDFIGEWKTIPGHRFSNVINASQSQFQYAIGSLNLIVNPDPLSELNILWGPPYIPIIPNPMLVALPFVHNHEKFSIVVLVQDAANSFDTFTNIKMWTMKPSEARFSFSHGVTTQASSYAIGKENFSSDHYRYWYSQYVVTPDTISDQFPLSANTRGVRFEFDIETKDVDVFSIDNLGLYNDGIQVAIPPLRLFRKSNLIYYPLTGAG